MDIAQKLREMEDLVMNIQGGVQVCKFDENLTILYVNYGFCNLIGYTCEEMEKIFQNQHIRFLPDSEVEPFKKSMNEQLKNSNEFTIEHQMRRKDGSCVWVINRGILIESQTDGMYIQCVFTDMTDHKKVLEELNRKKYEIEILTNNVEVAIINCDLSKECVINYANGGLFRLIGYTREQFKHKFNNSFSAIIHPDDCKTLHNNVLKQLDEKGCSKNVYRLLQQDGSIVWVLEQGTKAVNSSGETEFHGVLTNITQEEQNRQLLMLKNEELLLSEKRYEIAMENSEDVIFDYIIETKEVSCTAAALRKFKVKCPIDGHIEEIIKSGIIHPNSIQNFREIFEKIDKGVTFVSCRITGIVDSGKEVLFEVSLTNVLDEDENHIRAIGVIRNINEKKMLQSEKKYRRAMTADRLYATELNITQNIVVNTNDTWAKLLEIPNFYRVSEMVDYMCSNLVHPDFEEVFRKFYDKDIITSAFCNGQTQITAQYRRKDADNLYVWVESTMNIICDDITNDIKTRLYVKVINDQKDKEIKSLEEKRFYKAMLSNSVIVYEVNVTKDLIIRGNEYWNKLFDIVPTNHYTEMINTVIEKVVHPDDKYMVKETITRENTLHGYAKGESRICFEYRRLDEDGEYIWMSCDAHLFLDPICNDIKAFVYLQDINEKKIKQLDILYKAEHDGLTGFYNKTTVEKLVNHYLLSEEGKTGKHAFFIFDIDHFKCINDTFGHVFGDVILSRITQKMRDLFRDVDILGRIGGDEFIVLMKNIPSNKSALSKANEICSVVRETYTKNGNEYYISVSIGIAIFGTDGNTYCELYSCSDAALYQAKDRGKNQFCLYVAGMDPKVCDVEKIHELDFVESKSFEKNISEYVFRILYESSDKATAINAVLGLIGQQYNISRSYIVEQSANGLFTENTFEWYASESTPRMEELQRVMHTLPINHMKNFSENGMYFLYNLSKAPPELQELLSREKIKMILQFAIIKNGVYSGFVGFDQCDFTRNLTKEEITDLRNVANVLGMFISQMSMIADNEKSKNIINSLTNALSDYAYIVDKEQHKLLFFSGSVGEIAPNAKVGDYCYKAILNRESPCETCPMKSVSQQGNQDNYSEVHFEKHGVWMRVSASRIDWFDSKDACLIKGTDITQYKH
ncbi:MAG: PAS domain-containing protein [Oscillospiraceae bacterium]